MVECRIPEREVGGSKPTAAVLCPWARHFTPRKYWLITQEAVAPSRHDWKIVDWDVKPQHNQPINPVENPQDIFFSWRGSFIKQLKPLLWCCYGQISSNKASCHDNCSSEKAVRATCRKNPKISDTQKIIVITLKVEKDGVSLE